MAAGSDGWSPQAAQKAGTRVNSASPADVGAGALEGSPPSGRPIGGATVSTRVEVAVTGLPTEW
jgi:hypothetical protein